MIYLDNAATTLKKPSGVAAAVAAALGSFGNASRGAHEGALDASRIVFEAREKIAALFGCPRADHVAFTSNVTEALNIAISGVLRPGDHVITTALEHNSVLRPLYRLQAERGVELTILPADREGCLHLPDFEKSVRPNSRAIVCTHASNLTGNRVNIAMVGEIAKRCGLLFIVDAAQTAGATPIDMVKAHIDILCFTGHKSMMGPQGTGGMCIAEGVEIAPFKVGGTGVQSYLKTQPQSYPTRLEAGTLNAHGIAGLLAAVDFLNETGICAIEEKENRLMERFYQGVSVIDGVRIYGDFSGPERSPIVALNIRDYDSAAVADELAITYGIAVRAGAHCAPLAHAALGTEEQGGVRFSFNWFNTEEEVEAAIAAVRELAK